MGTVSFDGKFPGMRKAQDWIVYPMQDSSTQIKIQSDTRMASIDLDTGAARMSQPHTSGAYFLHLQLDRLVAFTLAAEDVQVLRQWVKSTGGTEVGTNGIVVCDNTGAIAL